MNRRDFSRLSALSLVATQIRGSGFSQTTTPFDGEKPAHGKKLGYAVIGLGSIANSFLEQIASSATTECVAFVTGHPDTKGKEWAQKFNLPNVKVYTYETMDQMKSNPAIQAAYVATPNALHKEHVIRSAKAAKHVLCEKPMAISSTECREMIAACRDAKVKLMVAYRMQYEPVYLETKKIIASGKLGRIVTVEGAFGFDSKPGVWRLTKKLGGGGALFDVGIYPLNATRFLLGENADHYTAQMSTMDTTSGRFREMEESTAWTMKFPSGAMGAYTTSYGISIPGMLRLHGEKGTVEMVNAFGNGKNQAKIQYSDNKSEEITSHQSEYQLQFEAEALADNIWNNVEPRAGGEEGLQDLLAMEAIYKASGKSL